MGFGATAAQAELSNGYITINYRLDGLCAAGPNANDTTGRVNVSFGATSSYNGEYLNLSQWEEDLTSTANRLGLQASSDGETLSASPNLTFPASNMIGTNVWFGLYGDFRDAGTGRTVTESPLVPGTTPPGTLGTHHYTALDMASDPDCAYTKAPLTVTGNGAVISNGDSTPSTLDRTNFGSVAVSASAISRTFELEPGASGVPSISSVALGAGSSSAFSLTSGFSGDLARGSTQEVTVSFDPTTAGEHTGMLVVSGPNIQTYTFTIKGTATGEPNLVVYGTSNGTTLIPDGDTTPTTAKSTDYGNVEYGGSNSPRSFLLYSNGTTPLAVNNVSITAGQGFAVTSPPALTIGAGGSSGMTIRFNPPGVGNYTATVTVTTNDPSSPYTFTLKGSGVDTVAPTATLGSLAGPSPVNAYTSRVSFSEPVTGFTTDDLILTNATAEITPLSASSYDVVLTPIGSGDLGYSIRVGAVEDQSGQANTAVFGPVTASFSGTPAIEIVSDNQPVLPGSTTPSTLNNTDFGTFEHPASTSRTFTIRNTGSARLAVSDIRDGSAAFTPSRGSVFVEPGEFAQLTIFYAPSAPGTHQTTIQMSTNVPTQSTYNFAIKAVSQDTTAPQTTLAPLSGPVNGVYTTTLRFSEPVNPFQGNELTLVNASAAVSGSGDLYTVTVTPLGSGTVSVAAPLGLTEDTWGNDSTAAGPVTAEFDETPPTATLSALSGPVNGVVLGHADLLRSRHRPDRERPDPGQRLRQPLGQRRYLRAGDHSRRRRAAQRHDPGGCGRGRGGQW
nr:choice-of-anchor D domain-containing protein [Oceanicola sp. S124]